MAKQLIFAAMFLGAGLLSGSGVAILQLWTRSSAAEDRIADLNEQLEAAKEEARNGKLQIREASLTGQQLQSGLTQIEQERDEFRTEVFRLRVQNEELGKAAAQAERLSNEVADLRSQLASAGQQPVNDVRSDGLVRVRKTDAAGSTAAKPVAEEFDGAGWTSVSRSEPE